MQAASPSDQLLVLSAGDADDAAAVDAVLNTPGVDIEARDAEVRGRGLHTRHGHITLRRRACSARRDGAGARGRQ
jgi:hypothetical protein